MSCLLNFPYSYFSNNDYTHLLRLVSLSMFGALHPIAPLSTQYFIIMKSIKWVPETPGSKSDLSLSNGSATLRPVHPLQEMGQ